MEINETQKNEVIETGKSEKPREYHFDEGVQEVIRKIEALLSQQNFVVVGINATGINVGKTYLSGYLAKYFKVKGYSAFVCSDFYDHYLFLIQHEKRFSMTGKTVIIFEAVASFWSSEEKDHIFFRNFKDRKAMDAGKEANLPMTKVDIYIGLCRPDRLFPENSGADIVICNEKAVGE